MTVATDDAEKVTESPSRLRLRYSHASRSRYLYRTGSTCPQQLNLLSRSVGDYGGILHLIGMVDDQL